VEVSTWLLEGPPWVRYRTRLDLLGQAEGDPLVQADRLAMLSDPQVRGLLAELAQWPGRVLKSHKEAGHPLHKLSFLAELGLRAGDPGMDEVIARLLEHQSTQGPFQVLMNIHPRYGGTGQDQWAWALCDAPLLLYALFRLGLGADRRVHAAAWHLAGLARDNGWPCAVSPEMGRFRGPGRKDDPCPYATLVMLKALGQSPELRDSLAVHIGAETLLTLWARSRELHPYLFHMGIDFRKLKAPLVWYDIAHVLDVLTRFPWLAADARLGEMAGLARSKADAQGRFTPESVWLAWGEWEFGQKKVPSRWLTLLVWRALRRMGVY
jgi:hypothetical protein